MSEKEIGIIGEIRIGELQSFTSNVSASQVKEKPLPAAINALDKGLAKTAVLQQFHFRVDNPPKCRKMDYLCCPR